MACFSVIEGWYNPVRMHSSPAHMAMVEGLVREAVFVGQATRYLVESPAFAQPLIIQQPFRSGAEELQPGSHAQISWDVADVHLIPVGKHDDAIAA